MQEKSVDQLAFVKTPRAIPTIEIDIDSIPEKIFIDDLIYAALIKYSEKRPKLLATIYIYEAQSVNFHETTFSAFIGIAGPEKLLPVIFNAFEAIAGARFRYSDYIDIDQGMPKFHIENGEIWRPTDSITWHSGPSDAVDEVEEITWDDIVHLEKFISNGATDSTSVVSKSPKGPAGLRFRQARADASIGSIRRKIEIVFGLPEGSVQICGPLGKILRADAKIATLRTRWGYER